MFLKTKSPRQNTIVQSLFFIICEYSFYLCLTNKLMLSNPDKTGCAPLSIITVCVKAFAVIFLITKLL